MMLIIMRYKNTEQLTGAPLGPSGPSGPENPGNPGWPCRYTTKREISVKKLTQNTTKWRIRLTLHKVIKKSACPNEQSEFFTLFL